MLGDGVWTRSNMVCAFFPLIIVLKSKMDLSGIVDGIVDHLSKLGAYFIVKRSTEVH